MRTADFIEESNSLKAPKAVAKDGTKRGTHANSRKNLVAPYPKGVSGNPGGRQKNDIAKEIAQAVFSENQEAIYKAMSKALLKGNAYVFKEIAERGFGKLKEISEVRHVHEDVSDADLDKRIAELERDLGLANAIDEAGRDGIAQAGTEKANGSAKDTPVLS